MKEITSKVDGLGSKWTVLESQIERSKKLKVDSQVLNWMLQKTNHGRYKGTKLNITRV